MASAIRFFMQFVLKKMQKHPVAVHQLRLGEGQRACARKAQQRHAHKLTEQLLKAMKYYNSKALVMTKTLR